MHGVGKVNVAPRDAFPPFPTHYVPCRPHLTALFVRDYWENKLHIMRELRNILSSHSLAVDHQRKVVMRTLGGSWWTDLHHMWGLWPHLWGLCSALHSTLLGETGHVRSHRTSRGSKLSYPSH